MKFWKARGWLASLLLFAGGLGAQDEGESSVDSPATSRTDIVDVPVEVLSEWFPETTARGLTVSQSWLPVYLELATSRASTQYLEIEGSIIGRQGSTGFQTRTRVEVSPGAAKKVWSYLHFDSKTDDVGEAQRARVRIFAGEQRVHEREWDLFTISGDRQFVTIPVWTSGENSQ